MLFREQVGWYVLSIISRHPKHIIKMEIKIHSIVGGSKESKRNKQGIEISNVKVFWLVSYLKYDVKIWWNSWKKWEAKVKSVKAWVQDC